MSARPNRFTATDHVTWDHATMTATVRRGSDPEAHYDLATLSGGELRTLCAVVFGADNVHAATAFQRRNALAKLDPALMTAPVVTPTAGPMTFPDPEPTQEPEPMPNTKPTPPRSTEATGPVTDDPMVAAFDMLRKAMAASVSEERVAEIVAEAVADATAAMRPTVIKVGTAPDVKLKGRPHRQLPTVLRAVTAGLRVLLVGPAGTGKSELARQVAEALAVDFSELPTDPTMSTVKLFGYMDANGRYVRTEFRDRFEHGGVFLVDEVDNGHASVVKGMNSAIAGPSAAFPDGTVQRHPQFYVIAAANTHGTGADREYVGASQLDASTLNRFFTIEVGYDEDLERELARAIGGSTGEAWAVKVHTMRGNQTANGLRVIISTRTVIDGAALLAVGGTEADAFHGTVGAPLDKTTKDKVLAGVTLAA